MKSLCLLEIPLIERQVTQIGQRGRQVSRLPFVAADCQALFKTLPRQIVAALDHLHEPEIVELIGDAVAITDGAIQRKAVPIVNRGAGVIAELEAQVAEMIPGQSFGLHREIHDIAVAEHLLQQSRALDHLTADEPVPPHDGGEHYPRFAERLWVFGRGLDPAAHIAQLEIEPGKPELLVPPDQHLVDITQIVVKEAQRANPHQESLVSPLELFRAILLNRQHHPEADIILNGRRHLKQALVQQRLHMLHQVRQRVTGPRIGAVLPQECALFVGDGRADHRFRRLERKAVDEDRQPAKHHLLTRIQQVVAPSDRVTHGLEPGRLISRATCQQSQPVVQPGSQCRQGEDLDPRRRQLDRQRQPVQQSGDLPDGLRHLRSGLE